MSGGLEGQSRQGRAFGNSVAMHVAKWDLQFPDESARLPRPPVPPAVCGGRWPCCARRRCTSTPGRAPPGSVVTTRVPKPSASDHAAAPACSAFPFSPGSQPPSPQPPSSCSLVPLLEAVASGLCGRQRGRSRPLREVQWTWRDTISLENTEKLDSTARHLLPTAFPDALLRSSSCFPLTSLLLLPAPRGGSEWGAMGLGRALSSSNGANLDIGTRARCAVPSSGLEWSRKDGVGAGEIGSLDSALECRSHTCRPSVPSSCGLGPVELCAGHGAGRQRLELEVSGGAADLGERHTHRHIHTKTDTHTGSFRIPCWL